MENESKSFQVEGAAQAKAWWLPTPVGLEVGVVRSEGKRNLMYVGVTREGH